MLYRSGAKKTKTQKINEAKKKNKLVEKPKKPEQHTHQPADEATEIQRNGLGGETYLITRRHFVLHPRGIAWQNVTVTPTKPASPSNANLALPANWSRVYDRKNIRLVALDTNG